MASEQESRKLCKASVGQELLEADRLPFLSTEQTGLVTKPAACMYIADLQPYILDLLDEYERYNTLFKRNKTDINKWKRNYIIEGETKGN